MKRTVTPDVMIEARLRPSWPAAPSISCVSPSAAATPTFEAAGIVVTEIRTPTSAPDFAEVSDMTPATPARRATITVN